MSVSALCVGHASWDLCMYVDAYPAENSKAETDQLIESGGGPAANAAWLLGRWGVSTALAAMVGRDRYGAMAADELRNAGVDCSLVNQSAEVRTPVSFIMVNRSTGSRTIINRKDSAAALNLQGEMFKGFDPQLLLFDGHELEASLAALEAIPRAISILDAGSLRDGTKTLAGKVQFLVCSERFAAQISAERNVLDQRRQCLRRLRELYGNVIVVTLGSEGCIFDDGAQQGHIPALVGPVKDTTAAGDIFHGAFAFALLQGQPLLPALKFATAAAGLSVQQFGGRLSAPNLDQVLQVISHG